MEGEPPESAVDTAAVGAGGLGGGEQHAPGSAAAPTSPQGVGGNSGTRAAASGSGSGSGSGSESGGGDEQNTDSAYLHNSSSNPALSTSCFDR